MRIRMRGLAGSMATMVALAVVIGAGLQFRDALEKRRTKAGLEAGRFLGTAILSAMKPGDAPTDLLRGDAADSLCRRGAGWQTVDLNDLNPTRVDPTAIHRARQEGVALELRCGPTGVAVALEFGAGAIRWEDGYYVRMPRGLGP